MICLDVLCLTSLQVCTPLGICGLFTSHAASAPTAIGMNLRCPPTPVGSSLLEQDSSSAAAGAVMGAAPDVEGGVAAGLGDAASLADAVAAGIIEAGEDETVAGGT